MDEENEAPSQDFIDSGVDEIAESMGFGETDELDDYTGTDEDDYKEQETPEEQTEEQPEQQVVTKAPPASWSKEKAETWAKLPPEAQEYIELREKQVQEGFHQYKQAADYAVAVDQAIAPFRAELQAQGVTNEVEAVHNLLSHHRALTQGSLEQRQQAFIQIGIKSGLIPADSLPEQQRVDPKVDELNQRLSRIEQQEKEFQQRQYEQTYQSIASEVDAFENDPAHEYFKEVSDDIIILLKSGIDLQSAYDKAVWANPVTRAKEIAKQTAKENERLRLEAEKARKATSPNVRSIKSTKHSNVPLGDWDSTMQETLQQIKNRA